MPTDAVKGSGVDLLKEKQEKAAKTAAEDKLNKLIEEVEKAFNAAETAKDIDTLLSGYLGDPLVKDNSKTADTLKSLAQARKDNIERIQKIYVFFDNLIGIAVSTVKGELETKEWILKINKTFIEDAKQILKAYGSAGDDDFYKEVKKIFKKKKKFLSTWLKIIVDIKTAPTISRLDSIETGLKAKAGLLSSIDPKMMTIPQTYIDGRRGYLIARQNDTLEKIEPAIYRISTEAILLRKSYDGFKEAFKALEAAAKTKNLKDLDNAIKTYYRGQYDPFGPLRTLRRPLKRLVAERKRLLERLIAYNIAKEAVSKAFLNRYELKDMSVSTVNELNAKIESLVLKHISTDGIAAMPKLIHIAKDVQTKDRKYIARLHQALLFDLKHHILGGRKFKPILLPDIFKVDKTKIEGYAKKHDFDTIFKIQMPVELIATEINGSPGTEVTAPQRAALSFAIVNSAISQAA